MASKKERCCFCQDQGCEGQWRQFWQEGTKEIEAGLQFEKNYNRLRDTNASISLEKVIETLSSVLSGGQ